MIRAFVILKEPPLTGRYEHRHLEGGIGHNLPQEARRAFAKAIVDVDRF